MGVFLLNSNYSKNKPAAAAMNRLPITILILAVVLFVVADLFFAFDFNWVDYADRKSVV